MVSLTSTSHVARTWPPKPRPKTSSQNPFSVFQVQIFCGPERYFPPRSEDGSGGERYREVGFLNINWQAGGFGRDDGQMVQKSFCFCFFFLKVYPRSKQEDAKVLPFYIDLRGRKWLSRDLPGMFNGAERAPLGARMCSSREPAKFNDGMMDMCPMGPMGVVFADDQLKLTTNMTISRPVKVF